MVLQSVVRTKNDGGRSRLSDFQFCKSTKNVGHSPRISGGGGGGSDV